MDIPFRHIFESVPGNYLIVLPDSPRFTIIAVSDAYCCATNTVRQEILQKGLFDVFPDNPGDPSADGVANLSASLCHVVEFSRPHKMEIQKYDIPIPHTNAFEERYWSPLNSPVVDSNGTLLCIVHHVEDVTEKIKTARALESQTQILKRTNEELEQFVRISSHDLQEPLRKIRTYADMVKVLAGDCMKGNAMDAMNKISLSAERMSSRMKALLQYAYLRKEDAFSIVDLQEVFGEVCDDLELLIHEKKVQLDVNALPVIAGIRYQLHELLFNLLYNAIKFSKENESPVIRVAAHQRKESAFVFNNGDQYCEIEIADNGIGFDQQYAEQIFTAFERLNQGGMPGGTGIGLALCRKVAHNHGGEIYATSERGKGATFRVVLPMK